MAKNKIKTKKSFAKRIVLKKGKALRKKGNKAHLKSVKSGETKRGSRKAMAISTKLKDQVKRALPNGK